VGSLQKLGFRQSFSGAMAGCQSVESSILLKVIVKRLSGKEHKFVLSFCRNLKVEQKANCVFARFSSDSAQDKFYSCLTNRQPLLIELRNRKDAYV